MHEVENFQETLRDEDDDNNQFGFGSGVIIDTSGFILTSNHVIESASKIEVKLSDNRKFVCKNGWTRSRDRSCFD